MSNTATIAQTQVVAIDDNNIHIITVGAQGPEGGSTAIPNNTFLGNVSGETAAPVALGVSTQQLLLNQAQQLPHWRAALGRVKAKVGNARVLFIGDSTTMGYLSNGATSGDMKPLSFPSQISDALNINGVPANTQNFMGNGFASSSLGTAQWDSRISVGSGWNTSGATNDFVGGEVFVASATTGNLAFTPTQLVDTFNVYYWGYVGSGTLSLDMNGSGAANHSTDTGTAGSIQKFTVTGAVGTNTVNVKWVSGAVFVLGFEAYNSTKKCVSCINAGWWGSASADWAAMLSKGYVSNPIAPLAPDLTIITLGINDWNGSVSTSAFTSNIQAIIAAAQATGDVILVSDNITASGVGASTQLAYDQALLALAYNNNIPFIDAWARWGAYSTAYNTGLVNTDNTHPTAAGYADIAAAVFEVVGATGGIPILDSSMFGTVTSIGVTGANGIGVSGSPVTTSGAIGLSLGDITPTSVVTTGVLSSSRNGASSSSTFNLTGTPFAGTATTSTPLLYINGGTAPTSWSTSGTFIGVNSALGSSASFLDFHNNGSASVFNVNTNGSLTTSGAVAITRSSASVLTLTGTVATGGTGTTNTPQLFIQPSGTTAATTWPTSGTGLGMNLASGFAGNFLDFRVNGAASVFGVNSGGTATMAGFVCTSQGSIGYSPSASNSSLKATGAVLTGGTGTTNFPHWFIQPSSATAATTWSTSGTGFGMNLASGFAGNFLDFRVNGGSALLAVSSAGAVTSASLTVTSSTVPANGMYLPAANTLGFAANTTDTGIRIESTGAIYGYAAKINAQTGTTYTLAAGDAGKIIELNNASAITLTFPNNLPAGFQCRIVQTGAGQVTFSAASGATLHNCDGYTKLAGQYAQADCYVTTNSGGTSAVYNWQGRGA